jgi:hypothetical protein
VLSDEAREGLGPELDGADGGFLEVRDNPRVRERPGSDQSGQRHDRLPQCVLDHATYMLLHFTHNYRNGGSLYVTYSTT